MEMSNKACQCPGLQLGHTKSRTSVPSPTSVPSSHEPAGTDNTAKKRIVYNMQPARPSSSNKNMRGTFKLPGYEPTRLNRLPASPQTLFKKEQLLAMLDDFSKHMYDAILQNGIHVPPSITLGLNGMGDIHLIGSHPDQTGIESLFANNSILSQQFHQIAFTSRLQQLANLQPGFSNDFFKASGDSLAQIMLVQMRSISLSPFSMTIDQASNTPDAASAVNTGGAASLFQMIISKSKDIPDLSSSNDKPVADSSKDTLPKINDPAPPVTDEPVLLTINDPAPPPGQKAAPEIPAHGKPHASEHHGHEHQAKLRCAINS